MSVRPSERATRPGTLFGDALSPFLFSPEKKSDLRRSVFWGSCFRAYGFNLNSDSGSPSAAGAVGIAVGSATKLRGAGAGIFSCVARNASIS